MSETPIPSPGQPVLTQVLAMLQPLVVWLLRSGVGYTDLTAALKPVFLEAARAELARTGAKQTDSAISLLSGVHRKDVRRDKPPVPWTYAPSWANPHPPAR